MYHNRIADFLDDSADEYPTAPSVSSSHSALPNQTPCVTTLGDIYEAARKRAVLECQIDELFNANDLLEE
jgi:hypothetical protein